MPCSPLIIIWRCHSSESGRWELPHALYAFDNYMSLSQEIGEGKLIYAFDNYMSLSQEIGEGELIYAFDNYMSLSQEIGEGELFLPLIIIICRYHRRLGRGSLFMH